METLCQNCQTTIEEEITEQPETITVEYPKHDRPKNFAEAILRMDLLRTISAITVIFLFVLIVLTFIINPNALDTKNNGMIGIVIGMVITKFGDVVNNYFRKAQE